MIVNLEETRINLNKIRKDDLICSSSRVLGNGVIDDIRDIIIVDENKFSRSKTVEIAKEVRDFNLELSQESRPYLLIGIGRWGSADHWLGVPVTWDEITGARVIIETGFKDMEVALSQGTHFFQNLNAFKVGYYNVKAGSDSEFIDWKWLSGLPSEKERPFTRHVRLDSPIIVKMDGATSKGVIIKPGKNSRLR